MQAIFGVSPNRARKTRREDSSYVDFQSVVVWNGHYFQRVRVSQRHYVCRGQHLRRRHQCRACGDACISKIRGKRNETQFARIRDESIQATAP